MKVKVISRNPDEYLRETKKDIHKRKYTYNYYVNSIHNQDIQFLETTIQDCIHLKLQESMLEH